MITRGHCTDSNLAGIYHSIHSVNKIVICVSVFRKKLKSVDSTENLVNISLSALALSDLAICLCLLPHGILKSKFNANTGGSRLIRTAAK